MNALNKVAEANNKELSELERTSSENARKLQKEINSYTNQVRDLEYQLIMAASEVAQRAPARAHTRTHTLIAASDVTQRARTHKRTHGSL